MEKTLISAAFIAASFFSAGATMAAASVDVGFSSKGSAQQFAIRNLIRGLATGEDYEL